MGSLTGCLKKAGDLLQAEDRRAILELADAYRKDGMSAAEAARAAVGQQLDAVGWGIDGAAAEMAGLPPIPRAEKLSAEDRAIERRFARQLLADFDGAVAEYSKLKDSGGGKVLNTDTARELSADYLKNRAKSAAVHEPASWFIKRLYERMLAERPKAGESPLVLFTAGGTGAGKTTAIDVTPAMQGLRDSAQIVYDTNMNTYDSARGRVQQALDAGKEVSIVWVYRDPVESLMLGALPRAERQAAKFGTGRTVPLSEHLKTHAGVADVIPRLVAEFGGNPLVRLYGLDNSLGEGNAVLASVADLAAKADNGRATGPALRAALEGERAAGRISEATYRGFLDGEVADGARTVGDAVARAGGLDRQDAGGQPKPAGWPAGAASEVVTERGLTVPVRWRLVEAQDLVTSHNNDLSSNPAFPPDLQPRDRSRAASADQISRIENAIRPELLGDSAKASDGAPIIGPDGVVESGNARTIALRRAYGSGKAAEYRAWVEANAARFGLTPEQAAGMREPVLVRERMGDVNRAEFARQANESAVARMSPTEQALADARRISDLTDLRTNEDGTINASASASLIRRFVQEAVSPTERGEITQAGGQLSQAGMQRLRNAIFARAYGDPELLAMLTESTDANVRNILAGMMRAAPDVARLRDLVDAGARRDVDITGPLVQAVKLFSQLRSEGRTVPQFLAQGSMFGDGVPAPVAALLDTLQVDSRAPKRVAGTISSMVDTINAMGDTRQTGLFGDAMSDADAATAATQRAAVQARLADAMEQYPDILVRMDGDDQAMTPAALLKRADDDAKAAAVDAELVRAAAECALDAA